MSHQPVAVARGYGSSGDLAMNKQIKIERFICSVVKHRVEFVVTSVNVPGRGVIPVEYGPCSHQTECGVETGKVESQKADWTICPFVSHAPPPKEDRPPA